MKAEQAGISQAKRDERCIPGGAIRAEESLHLCPGSEYCHFRHFYPMSRSRTSVPGHLHPRTPKMVRTVGPAKGPCSRLEGGKPAGLFLRKLSG